MANRHVPEADYKFLHYLALLYDDCGDGGGGGMVGGSGDAVMAVVLSSVELVMRVMNGE